MSALGAALLAGVTLATMVAPAANAAAAAPAAPASDRVAAQQIRLIDSSNPTEHTALVKVSNAASVQSFTLLSLAQRAAATINVIPRDGDLFNLQVDGGDDRNQCLAYMASGKGPILHPQASCDLTNGLFTQPAPGVFKTANGWYLTSKVGYVQSAGVAFPRMTQVEGEATRFTDVNLVAPLTAAGEFTAANGDLAKIKGTAEPGALVTAKNSAGGTVSSVTADTNGDFSLAMTAPNRGGVYAISVTQTVDGTESTAVKVDLDYGKAVTISTPANNADHAPGELAMTGTGTPGGSINVFDNSGRTPIGMTTVNASGAWSLNTSALNSSEHKLEVKQLSKGNNTTTSTVTLNPGGTVTPPAPGIGFEITTPKNDSTIETSDKQVTFTGRGNPGSKVSIMNGARNIGTVDSVPASGDWSFTATMNYAEYDLTAYYKKVATGAVTSKQPLHITVTDATAARPFVISTPANNSTVETADKSVRFSGTGNAGGKVTIMNSSRTIGTADIDQNGQWSFTATMNYAEYNLTAYYKKVPTGAVTSQQALNITVTAGQLGFVIGSPAAGTTVDRGNIAFSGTGKAGSVVTIFLNSTKRGTATTAADGTWTVPVTVNTPGQYDFTVYYKANPTDASAPSVKHALTVR